MSEVTHKIKGQPRVTSDGGSAGFIEYDFEDGGTARIGCAIQQPPAESEEPTGGGDPESKAKLAKQKTIAEGELEDTGADAEEAVELKGRLPEDFPGKADLDAADPPIHTYKQLSKFADDYTKIPGIGPKTAEKIKERLAAAPETE